MNCQKEIGLCCETIVEVQLVLISLLWVLISMMMVRSNEPNYQRKSLQTGGRSRTYLVHEPPKQGKSRPRPLVLVFHGGGSNAEAMMHFSGLDETADRAGFITVYPNGTGRYRNRYTWNAGRCCAYAQWNDVDDVSFARELIRELKRDYPVDPQRIYAAGMSNGAMMAYRLASELADELAAIAPVAGAMATETCRPSRPVSVVHFHGTEDQFAPFEGGFGQRSLVKVSHLSVEHSIQAWVAANGCIKDPVEFWLPSRVSDGTKVQSKSYGNGNEGAEVLLYVVEGGGHTWPGRQSPLKRLGKSTQNISANDLMWAFFQRHRR